MEITHKSIDMKTIFRFVFAFICFQIAASAAYAQKSSDPEGYLTYSLPQTVIALEVEAIQEKFYAGPYAEYAEKYLGIKVRKEDESKFQLKSIKMTPYVEADQTKRYSLNVEKGEIDARVMKLSAAGLVSFADARFGEETAWRFPMAGKGDFSDKGVSSNLTSSSAILFQGGNKEDVYNKVSVQQDMVVEKSMETKASEMAQMVLDIREQRYNILIGNTDATYSGEAMQATIEELTRLEKEYMMLFIGYSEFQTQSMNFEVVPVPGEQQKYIAFRLSDTAGLVPSDNLSGKPILMEIVPQEFVDTDLAKQQAKAAADAQAQLAQTGKAPKEKTPAEKKETLVNFRIPAVCTVKIMNGVDLLLQSRIPVYQLGKESSLPVNVIL